MVEDCPCKQAVMYSVEKARQEARRAQAEHFRRLNSFRDGIEQGAREVAARHLYLAGINAASLDHGMTMRPDGFMVVDSLRSRLVSEPRLLSFYNGNSMLVETQSEFVDVERVLRSILRDRQRARGLLEARIRSEFSQAEDSLSRLERLEGFLTTWRENVRLESQVGVDPIVDMHK